MNITLSVDDRVIHTVRKIAIDKNTTLTAMVRSYLESLAERDLGEGTGRGEARRLRPQAESPDGDARMDAAGPV